MPLAALHASVHAEKILPADGAGQDGIYPIGFGKVSHNKFPFPGAARTDGIKIINKGRNKMNGKWIGVDYGDVRTGIASSDLLGLMASAVGTIKPGGMRNTAIAVAKAAKEQNAVGIVVGLPKNMDGSEGPRAGIVRAFVDLLRAETDLPILFEDERMTTMEANRFLSATDTYGKKRKEKVDALSAELILQSWLDRRRREESAGAPKP